VGRKRKPGFDWLPPRVYVGKAQFELRPRDMSTINLCVLTSERSTVWKRYHEEMARLAAQPDPGLFGTLLTDYMASREFEKLADETRRAYERYAVQLRGVFGHMPTNDIEPVDIREWLDARAAAKSETLANREFAMLGSVFRWGRERGRCAGRPTKDVRRFSEQPRDRDVTEAELAAFRVHCGPRLNAYLDLRMATGLRQGEVLLGVPIAALRAVRAPLNDDDPGVGLPFDKPSKNGLKRPYKWSPGLQKAADAILAAGYLKLRTINEPEEIDALPNGSIVMDSEPDVLAKKGGTWQSPNYDGDRFEARHLDYPVTLIHEGEDVA